MATEGNDRGELVLDPVTLKLVSPEARDAEAMAAAEGRLRDQSGFLSDAASEAGSRVIVLAEEAFVARVLELVNQDPTAKALLALLSSIGSRMATGQAAAKKLTQAALRL
ncbi:MAG: hypothetical protein AB1921_14550 [Thermodesulfobacteriota bacterium]